MATTNTTNFSVSTADIIGYALRKIGRLGAGASPTTEDNTNCLLSLNMIIKALNAQGYQVFTYERASYTLPANTTSVTIGPTGTIVAPRPVRIPQAWIRDSNNIDQPLVPMSRSDYNNLSNKTSTGKPVNFYYDAQVVSGSTWNNLGTVYLWPLPDVATYTMHLSYQAPIQDAGATTTEFELPQEWFLPLGWLLAAEIGHDYSVNLQKVQIIRAQAEAYLEKMTDFNREEASVYFTASPELAMQNSL
jgi:hypothetical protein